MDADTLPYPAAETKCADENCDRPAWLSCPEGKCLFHSPYNGCLDAAARTVWETARRMAQAGDCDFCRWHFPQDPDLDLDGHQGGFFGVMFSREALFAGAAFSEDAWFDGATFSGQAWFNGATFSGEARFRCATFSRLASFARATFSGNAWFEGATFSSDASFGGATFSREALFAGAAFSGDALFAEATFSRRVEFQRASFSRGALFSGVTFSGRAEFQSATFSGGAFFRDATFSRGALFVDATFRPRAFFEGAMFRGEARFGGATFSGDARFRGATFSEGAFFRRATFSGDVEFEGARWPGRSISFDSPRGWPWMRPCPFARPREGETAYRLAKQAAQERGDYTEAGRYHYAEQCAIEDRGKYASGYRPWRPEFRLWLWRLIFGRLVFGYGERPSHPLLLGLAVILAWALVFGCIDGVVPDPESAQTSLAWWQYGYFSVVTFTTLGYGDYQPKEGWAQILAGVEAALGAALLATFVVCLTRKYMR